MLPNGSSPLACANGVGPMDLEGAGPERTTPAPVVALVARAEQLGPLRPAADGPGSFPDTE
eukprot:4037717-Alexandrium_andersonii.AAC.1